MEQERHRREALAQQQRELFEKAREEELSANGGSFVDPHLQEMQNLETDINKRSRK